MASSLLPIGPASVPARASSSHVKLDNLRKNPPDNLRKNPPDNLRKNPPSNWWAPIFGWSSEPDYIDSTTDKSDLHHRSNASSVSSSEPQKQFSRPRFAPGCLTEEKAKQLRLKMLETETFHDGMYHSAIASRLASDFKNRSDT